MPNNETTIFKPGLVFVNEEHDIFLSFTQLAGWSSKWDWYNTAGNLILVSPYLIPEANNADKFIATVKSLALSLH